MRRRVLLLAASHVAIGAIGFAGGIYALPILIAPPGPTEAELQAVAGRAVRTGAFRRDLAGSDMLHWGEGEVSVSAEAVSLRGRLAPGPDYKLYLSPEFVETEADFLRVRPRMRRVGDVKTFDGFVVPLSPDVDLAAVDTVVVWCETFGQFITSARIR